MLALASLALAQTPSADALLALDSVRCRADRIAWQTFPNELRWSLTVNGTNAAYGQTGALAVEREVTSPASRAAHPGAPWQWTERIRITNPAGGPVTQIPAEMGSIDATFRCTDLTDPTTSWVDVEVWWDEPSFSGQPAPGVLRCASADRDVVWVTSSRFAGVAPRPGDVLGTQTLAVGGVVVGGSVSHMGEHEPKPTDPVPAPLPQIIAESTSSTALKTKNPNHHRTRQEFVFTRADGADVLPGRASVRATLTCESFSYPPVPRAPPGR